MDENFHIAQLIARKIRGEIDAVESAELDAWLNRDPEHRKIFDRATDPKTQLNKLEIYQLFRKEKVWSGLEQDLFPTKTVRLHTRRLLRIAASILMPVVVLGGAAYLFFSRPSNATLAELDRSIVPGSQKAVLILSDGSSVNLESDAYATDLREGNVTIRNEQNQLSYSLEASGMEGSQMAYNELRTPRGGGYHLNLSDGTSIWLNAGSTLRFPVSFADSVREVNLEGEGYFEVAKDVKPFVVHSGRMDVSVLGTSFNVTAYADEPDYRTTLVEGKVRIDLRGEDLSPVASRVLMPDRQAIVGHSVSEIRVEEVNTSYYTSWMEGKVEFDNESLDVVMKRLARLYDFEYRFENQEAKEFHFSARLDRGEKISTILQMLEMTAEVEFEYRRGIIVVQ